VGEVKVNTSWHLTLQMGGTKATNKVNFSQNIYFTYYKFKIISLTVPS